MLKLGPSALSSHPPGEYCQETFLKTVMSVMLHQGVGNSNPQRGAEVRSRLIDQECGDLWRGQRLLPGESAAEGL